jgi:hypothetical protein
MFSLIHFLVCPWISSQDRQPEKPLSIKSTACVRGALKLKQYAEFPCMHSASETVLIAKRYWSYGQADELHIVLHHRRFWICGSLASIVIRLGTENNVYSTPKLIQFPYHRDILVHPENTERNSAAQNLLCVTSKRWSLLCPWTDPRLRPWRQQINHIKHPRRRRSFLVPSFFAISVSSSRRGFANLLLPVAVFVASSYRDDEEALSSSPAPRFSWKVTIIKNFVSVERAAIVERQLCEWEGEGERFGARRRARLPSTPVSAAVLPGERTPCLTCQSSYGIEPSTVGTPVESLPEPPSRPTKEEGAPLAGA